MCGEFSSNKWIEQRSITIYCHLISNMTHPSLDHWVLINSLATKEPTSWRRTMKTLCSLIAHLMNLYSGSTRICSTRIKKDCRCSFDYFHGASPKIGRCFIHRNETKDQEPSLTLTIIHLPLSVLSSTILEDQSVDTRPEHWWSSYPAWPVGHDMTSLGGKTEVPWVKTTWPTWAKNNWINWIPSGKQA